ncbi:MAG: cyanophycin synthetase, partial [Bacillota bacterium]|nr:cyanophycin synthetase [Bacillota bacterium]
LDDPTIKAMRERLSARAVTYGLREPADLTAREIRLREGGSSFIVVWKGKDLGRLELVIPGRHNVQNALATVAVALETGVALEDVASALATFHGARRRFQYMGEVGGVLIVDDYAHHPTEIDTTLQAARDSWGRRIVAVFQPHRYTRTHFLMEEFAGAFGAADEVIIGRIYSPPPDQPIPGVTSERLVELIRQRVRCPVHHIPENDDIVAYLAETVRPGDLVITMGAGDIWTVARDLAVELQKRQVRSAAP